LAARISGTITVGAGCENDVTGSNSFDQEGGSSHRCHRRSPTFFERRA
jgi:hypothetical protein